MAKDMRSWLSQLEKAGEVSRVTDEVNLEWQMAQRLATSKEKALFFENVKGCPGWRVLGQAPTNIRQVGLAFGTDKEKVTAKFMDAVDKGLIKCKMVSSGPVKEAVLKGSDVHLTKLPIHVHGHEDKGPYIADGLCIIKDPETGIRNMSFHRLQIKGDNKTGILLVLGRHAWLVYQKYEAMNKPMPIAVVIGHHPMYYFAAAYTGPLDLDEFQLAGALLEEPVELVRCETIDLEVPAHAELVLEGEVPPKVREIEGPFSELQNYYAASRENPIINVKAITMRKDAIFKTIQHAPPDGGTIYTRVSMGAMLFRDLKNTGGYADLRDVYCNWGSTFGVVIKMIPKFYGEVKPVLIAALSSTYLHPKVAIAVDEDVDIYDPQDVAWAITTRVNPVTDIVVLPDVRAHPLDIASPEVSKSGLTTWQRVGSRMGIDATKPPTTDPAARALFERAVPPSPKRGG